MQTSKTRVALAAACLAMAVSAAVQAETITQKRTIHNANAVQAGVAGIGAVGTGSIAVSGVSGTVTRALLYWHGVGNPAYDNANVSINGHAVTGVSQGDGPTNCWERSGFAASRAYEADVTAFVPGNGTYALSGLASGASGNNANGASLVVFFNDGNASNNRDYVVFTGNDSDFPNAAFPADPGGWSASLPGIAYAGGTVKATAHVADGQAFPFDTNVTFSTASGTTTVTDTASLFDGNSVPSAGNSRASNGGLYDVHAFDITGAFGASAGTKTLNISHPTPPTEGGFDCLALTAVVLDLEPNSAPPSPINEDGNTPPPPPPPTTCAAEGYIGMKLDWCRNICEKGYTGATLKAWIQRWTERYHTLPACAR